MTSDKDTTQNDFWKFEHTGWERKKAVTYYHDYFGKLTSQAIESLVMATNVKVGSKVLDIATGPGYAAAMANQHGGDVIGIDFSSSMIEKARINFPHIKFLVGDAEKLPFENNLFDSVIMNF